MMNHKDMQRRREESLQHNKKVYDKFDIGTTTYFKPVDEEEYETDEYGYIDGVVKDVKYNEFCCDVRVDIGGVELWIDGEDAI